MVENEFQICFTFVFSLTSLHLLNTFILEYNELAIWYLMHSLGNIYITYFCLFPIQQIIYDPIYHLINTKEYYVTMKLIIILHVYHLLFFKCTKSDIFHHIIFVGFGSLVVFTFKNGYFLALSNFFICGLPGAIDYFFLFLYKINKIDKNSRLKVAVFVNLWIRSIGLNMVACFALINLVYSKKEFLDIFCCLLQILMTVGNGNMYLQDIIYTAGKRQIYS